MITQTYVPRPPLSDFVGLFWYREGYNPAHARERCLPGGSAELIINLHQDMLPVFDRQNPAKFQPGPGSVLYGPHSEYFVIDPCQVSILGVHFKPGGVFPFFNLSASELHNNIVSLDALWGRQTDELRNRLLEAETTAARFRLLEQMLLTKARQPLVKHPAITFALSKFPNSPHTRTIHTLAEHIGLSQTRLIALFREQVGLTPKLYGRVQRFQAVLHLLERPQPVGWVDASLTCGYFDQSHFIHDFRTFSGFNPTAYLAQRSNRLSHVSLMDGV
jgi:AraC-like DNA-binding protein